MENIFAHIEHATMKEYDTLFYKETGQRYPDFLEEKYVKENWYKNKLSKLLGITVSRLSNHLKYYGLVKSTSNKSNDNNLFTKTISMVEKETGRKIEDIYNELIAEGLTETQIAAKLHLSNVSTIKTHLYQKKREQERKDNPDKLIIQGLSGKKPKEVEQMFRDQMGMEIKDWLKQKYIDENLSLQDIADLIGMSPRRLSGKVRQYGLYKTASQARRGAMERGTIDYKEIGRKRRIALEKHGSGSQKQDMFRELLKHHLELNIDQYPDIDIIMGYNEYCILRNLEVDIPIVIIYKDKLIKIAIEYDGDFWHEGRPYDDTKDKLLKEKQWKLIRIEELYNKGNNLGLLEKKAKDTVNQIISYINS